MHVVHSFQHRLDVSATIRLSSVGPKQIFVGFHLSLPGFFLAGLSMEQLLNSPSEFLLLNGGLQILSALFQFIQTVGERHGDFSCAGTMYGAISSKFETLSGCPAQSCASPVVSKGVFVSVLLQTSATFSSPTSLRKWRNPLCVYCLPWRSLSQLLRRCAHLTVLHRTWQSYFNVNYL